MTDPGLSLHSLPAYPAGGNVTHDTGNDVFLTDVIREGTDDREVH
jgi:hypothetical protein